MSAFRERLNNILPGWKEYIMHIRQDAHCQADDTSHKETERLEQRRNKRVILTPYKHENQCRSTQLCKSRNNGDRSHALHSLKEPRWEHRVSDHRDISGKIDQGI